MSNSFISFEQSRQFSKLITDYINNGNTLAGFYEHNPLIESYKKVIEQKNYDNSFRPVLVETIRAQYAGSGIDLKKQKAVSSNIDSLLEPCTYTVTTGHQLCLFTGPLYFIYKILTTIKWCEELQRKYPENNFVPVFWMASEDHDFAEINHFYINKEKITWDIDSKQQPVGRLPLNDFSAVVNTILGKAENDFAQKQLETLTGFYTSSGNLAEATRKLVHHLFADKGLVILDADNKELKQLFVPYIKTDILEQSNFEALQQTNAALRKQYKTQVNGREINFFYLGKNGRKLIKKEKAHFIVEDTDLAFTADEMEQEITANPDRFSPNVILRPLYQEVILPNLSYVGGPGEIAYWLQLKGVFENNAVSFPVLTLRNFIMLLKEQHKNQLEKLGLSADDFFIEEIDLERKLVELNNDGGQKMLVLEFDAYLQKLVDIAQKTDNKISSKLITHKTEWKKELLTLSSDLDKQQRHKVDEQIKKALKMKAPYFLGNTIQERFDNILSYAISQSVHQLINHIYEHTSTSPKGINKVLIAG